jgi:hypothetical protein
MFSSVKLPLDAHFINASPHDAMQRNLLQIYVLFLVTFFSSFRFYCTTLAL